MRSPVLAGRCACGVRLDLVAEDPDVHLICAGMRRCGTCQEIKSQTLDFYHRRNGRPRWECKACHRTRAREWERQAYRTRPEYRAKRRLARDVERASDEYRKREAERQRRYDTAHKVERNAARRASYRRHREQRCMESRARYLVNREARLAAQARYDAAHAGEIRVKRQLRAPRLRVAA